MGMYSITVLIQYYDLSKYKENIVGYLAEFLPGTRADSDTALQYDPGTPSAYSTVQYSSTVL